MSQEFQGDVQVLRAHPLRMGRGRAQLIHKAS